MTATTSGGVAMRGWRLWWMACAVLLLAGCASTGKEMSALQRAQYSWSAAIRWNDFEGAWNLVDPDWREAHPLDDLQLERYRQIQVSHYRDLASSPGESEAMREIEIGVINRHTMAERTVRYTEQWRYDAEKETWWITGGLPDFWAGE
ncbi:hypothetical protein [uncultured Luteimonas sp.]|uniref:hypothetical protein n=1 Tax=uncultured Luteimonas sp. TaxID=453144 RepID=UPI00262A460B|nr:hypothetical protein [uncultured Luteimonas sp.]